jgi:hypothetical protein
MIVNNKISSEFGQMMAERRQTGEER